ncbi:MAG: GNAT family N-acetyltransferase, partial [Acidimicrobiia bacterium]
SNRFDLPGEVFLEVRRGGRLVALGGLNRDPYLDDPSVGRIRHVYVHPDARDTGVGHALVTALVEHARDGFARVRLRAGPPCAGYFYVALGFVTTPGEENSTHELKL